MITYQSDLINNSFYIIKNSCELIVPKSEIDPRSTFLSYPIDIDYSIKERKGEKTFRILMDISINYPGKLPGYSIYIESMGDFSINNEKKKSIKEREHLINYIAVERCIEYCRGVIAYITSQYPLGKYFIAGINMEALYLSKLEQQKKINTSESKIQTTQQNKEEKDI